MTPLMDEDAKYLVYKQEEMTNWVAGNLAVAQTIPAALDDAVVIRLKDPFAATALHTYSNTILSVIELIPSLDPDDHQRMIDIADYFAQMASESESIKGKRLPD